MTRVSLLVAMAVTAGPVAAAPRLQDVAVAADAAALTFTLSLTQAIARDAVSAEVVDHGALLVVRLDGVSVSRRWLSLADPAIRRSLVRPARERTPPAGAVLRVRFARAWPAAGAARVGITLDGPRVVVRLPRATDGPTRLEPALVPVAPALGPPAAEEPPIDTSLSEASPPEESLPQTSPSEGSPPNGSSPEEPPLEASPPREPAASVAAGLDRLDRALHAGLRRNADLPRVALLPLDAVDDAARAEDLAAAATAALAYHLDRRPQLFRVPDAAVRATRARYLRGRTESLSLSEAATLGALLGADTVIAGAVAATGDTVEVRAVVLDASTGRLTMEMREPFARDAFVAFAADARSDDGYADAAWRSALVPGWAQVRRGDTARGAALLTLFGGVLAVGVTSALLGRDAEQDYRGGAGRASLDRRADADAHYDRATGFLVAAGVVWSAAMIDALTGCTPTTTWQPHLERTP